MKTRVHPAAWIGLAINFLSMVGALYAFDERSGPDTLTLAFSIVFVAGFILSLIGVLMLAAGNPAGGIVGIIGSVIYVPIGMVCAIGCSISRKNIEFASFDTSTAAFEPQPASPAQSGSASFPADSPAQPRSDAALLRPAPRLNAPVASFPFVDYRWLGVLLVAISVVGFLIVIEYGGGGGGSVLTPAIFGIIMFVLQQRQQNFSVFALYDDSLECVPNQWASPVRIPYANIAMVILHKRKAEVMVRNPDISQRDKKIIILFGNIPSEMRDDAKRVLAQKMRELGILTERT